MYIRLRLSLRMHVHVPLRRKTKRKRKRKRKTKARVVTVMIVRATPRRKKLWCFSLTRASVLSFVLPAHHHQHCPLPLPTVVTEQQLVDEASGQLHHLKHLIAHLAAHRTTHLTAHQTAHRRAPRVAPRLYPHIRARARCSVRILSLEHQKLQLGGPSVLMTSGGDTRCSRGPQLQPLALAHI
jgi:hypothetical protein